MLILVYLFTVNVALPRLGSIAYGLVQPLMLIVITLAGIVMIFGAVGFKISNNLGSTIVNGIFRAIGYICRVLIQAIGWGLRHFFQLIPRVFTGARRSITQMGFRPWVGNVVGTIITVAFIVIVI